MVGIRYINAPKEVWIHLVFRMRLAGVGLGSNRLKAHFTHEPLNSFTVNFISLATQIIAHLATAIKWVLGVFFVD